MNKVKEHNLLALCLYAIVRMSTYAASPCNHASYPRCLFFVVLRDSHRTQNML